MFTNTIGLLVAILTEPTELRARPNPPCVACRHQSCDSRKVEPSDCFVFL